MEKPTLNILLGQGWTYCPRCNADVMVPDEDGWHCPWCGISAAVWKPKPIPEMLVWTEALTSEQIQRECEHLQAKTTAWMTAHKDDKPLKIPERLRWFNRLVRPLAWALSCKVMVLWDKKDKEVTSEQGKQENQVL